MTPYSFRSSPYEVMHQNHAKSTPTLTPTSTLCRLLLVEDNDTDASLITQVLEEEMLALDLHRVRTTAEAHILFSEMSFDAVVVNYELPDGNCFDVLSTLLNEDRRLPVVVLTQYGHEDVAISAMKAGASDCIRKELDHRHLEGLSERLHEAIQRHQVARQVSDRVRRQEQMKLIDTLRATVATVKHEINNPLAIISGNAQLLLELSRMMDLDEDLVKPIRDIEEASLRITDSLNKLNSIKDLVARDHVNGKENLNGISYQ